MLLIIKNVYYVSICVICGELLAPYFFRQAKSHSMNPG